VYAGGANDQVSVVGSGNDVIFAATGNETLNASTATGNDLFIAGAGTTTIEAGSGADTFGFFASRTVGGSESIYGATASDIINVIGYSAPPMVTPTGSGSMILLSDNTRITIFGVTPVVKTS
jgi:Ca2+-binding RTX toxin-like protein